MGDVVARYGPTALIAGGSEGVGASYAHMLAARGFDLVLVARSEERLDMLRADLAAAHPDRHLTTIAADLTDPQTPTMLAERLKDTEIGLLICNAGANQRNADLLDIPLEYLERLTALNATTPMALVHHFGRAMRQRKRGGIILVSSLAYLVGGPKIAAYSAAKAFSTTLGEALWFELKPHGVDVLVHALGSVDTPFVERHFPAAYGSGEKPNDVARAGLEALGQGPLLRAGQGDAFHAMLNRLPRSEAVAAMHRAGKHYD